MTAPAPPSTRFRTVMVVLLLFLGVQLWLVASVDVQLRRGQSTLIAIAALLAMLPPVARGIARFLDRIAQPSRRAALLPSMAIFTLSTVFLYFQAISQSRDLGLKYQDEYSYALQTRMIAHGKLWMPAHPLGEFFQNFQVIATPVYGSIYFPGTAILNAPAIWMGWPHWVIPLLAAALCVAMVYRVFTELIDGVAGLLGALVTISIPLFREQSIMLMAQIPALLGALMLIWAWLRWRGKHTIALSVLLGAIAGWLVITRPVDAMVVIVPVAIAMLLDLRRMPLRQSAAIVVAGLTGAVPFLGIQLAFNWRVTGNLTHTPFSFYTQQVYPQGVYGFHGTGAGARPTWDLPQVQQAYLELSQSTLGQHTPARKLALWRKAYLPAIFQNLLPHPAMMLLVPVAVLGVKRNCWVIVAMLPLFVLLYFPYVFFIRHYTLTLIPAVIIIALLGMRVAWDISQTARPQVQTFLVGCVTLLTISTWPQFDRVAVDSMFISEPLREIEAKLANLPHQPAIVLFRYGQGNLIVHEPVYNPDVTWPDDAPVIRAHDRGEQNASLYRYYAEHQPQRWVYLFDRADGSVRELGRVTDLAGRP